MIKERGEANMFTYEEIMSLNELEMSVYQYVLKHKEKAGYMKIRELAEEAHVSTTTVLRFCKKMGCGGYSEFKVQLKLYLSRQIEPETDVDISNLADYLNRFKTEEYMRTIDRAVALLKESSNIFFIGVGTSGMLAKYGSRYFSNVGWLSLCITFRGSRGGDCGGGSVRVRGDGAGFEYGQWTEDERLQAGFHHQHPQLHPGADERLQYFLLYAGEKNSPVF